MTTDPLSTWLGFLMSTAAPKGVKSPMELDGYLTGVVVSPRSAAAQPLARWNLGVTNLPSTALIRLHAGGLVIAGEPFFTSQSEQLAALAVWYSVPTIYDPARSIQLATKIQH